MRRGLGAHKRKTRRISDAGAARRGHSASPRPSLGGAQGNAPHAIPPTAGQHRKASTAPSSPLDSTAVGTTAWDSQRRSQGGSGGGTSAREGDSGTTAVVPGLATCEASAPPQSSATATTSPLSQSGSSQSQQAGTRTAEPTMGTIFTEWFQKLFAPNESNSNNHGSSGSTSAGGATKTGGANSAAAANNSISNRNSDAGAGGGRSTVGTAAAKAFVSGEEREPPSNKTSAASDLAPRPPTPRQGASPTSTVTENVAGAVTAATSANGDSRFAHGGAPTEESIAPVEESGGGGAGAAVVRSGHEAGEQSGKDGEEKAAASQLFFGLFTRGFGGGGSNKGKNSKDRDATTAAAAAAATTTTASAEAAAASTAFDTGAPDAGTVSSSTPDTRTNGGAGAAVVAGTAGAAGVSSTTEQGASGAGGCGGQAAGGEQGMAREGSVGMSSRSTSPSRAQALSVGSDDGEEEHLYTAGTHQGARPSIDDFSSLRVLGKGSYGKVVLVRRKSTGVLYAMKILKKGDVVRKRQVERTKIERRVLGNVEHPFLMRLHYAFQTDNKLYLVLDYCPGGELFFHLSRYKRFPEGVVRFYAAELVLALKHLHDNNIIYRDIKPENILLDADGHIKLGDFGLAKDNVSDSTFGAQSVCGTPEYMAPEVINKAGHGTAVDWWGLGMLMYEMLTGLPPWYTKDRQKLFERLRGAPLVIPKNISAPSASIIGGLLTRNPSKRLGTLGALQVMNHEFFRGLDWPSLLAKRIPAPLNPCRNQRQGSESTHNFDPQFTRMPIDTMSLGGGIVSPGPDGHFDGFTYEIPGVILEGNGGDGR